MVWYIMVWFGLLPPTFSCNKSSASCSPTAFISVRCSADVTYMCISKNLNGGKLIFKYFELQQIVFFHMLFVSFFSINFAEKIPCCPIIILVWRYFISVYDKIFYHNMTYLLHTSSRQENFELG